MNDLYCFQHKRWEPESLWCKYTPEERIKIYHRMNQEKRIQTMQKVEDISLFERITGYMKSVRILSNWENLHK